MTDSLNLTSCHPYPCMKSRKTEFFFRHRCLVLCWLSWAPTFSFTQRTQLGCRRHSLISSKAVSFSLLDSDMGYLNANFLWSNLYQALRHRFDLLTYLIFIKVNLSRRFVSKLPCLSFRHLDHLSPWCLCLRKFHQ